MTYRLETLGTYQLSGPPGPIEIKGSKLSGLLAYLVCEAPEGRSRTRIVSVLWGSLFEEQAGQNLRATLRRLRQLLWPSAITEQSGVLSIEPGLVSCDAIELERLSKTSRVGSWRKAVKLYKGDFLDGLLISESVLEDWSRNKQQR